MKKQPEPTPIKTLRDAYKVRGFRVLATLDSYDIEPPALVLTLNRRAKKTMCGGCGKICRSGYDSRWRRARDLKCGDREVYVDFEMRRVARKACGVKNEKLAFLSSNTKYTLRFAMQIGGLCRAMTIQDVARLMYLHWHAVRDLDKMYMREQLRVVGDPKSRIIGRASSALTKSRSDEDIPIASSSAIWSRAAPYGSAAPDGRKPTWICSMPFSASKIVGKSGLLESGLLESG